jgi:type VI protein secretion system component Hcp
MSVFTYGDGLFDADEGLRVLDLASAAHDGDMVMLLENWGGPMEGECKRKFADNKARIDIKGYMIDIGRRSMGEEGKSAARVQLSFLRVVRQSDAASASLAGMVRAGAGGPALTFKDVRLSVFKAGGDPTRFADPTLELVLEEAIIMSYTMLTSSKLGVPHEIVDFSYIGLEVRSAWQDDKGLRGPVRTARFDRQVSN